MQSLNGFPPGAKRRVGFELWQVQRGGMPDDFNPMSSAGAGVYEIRVHVEGEWRLLYVAKFAEAVYVLHAFAKKTRKTSKADMEIAAQCYRQLLKERKA